jgi:hypothetical protein
MKTFIVILFVSISLLLGGCSENSAPVSSIDNQVTLAKVPVPIKIVIDGTSSVNPANNWQVTFNSTFSGSHLGNGIATGTANLVFTSASGGNLINGSFIVTAANGDVLNFINGSGTFVTSNSITQYDLNFTFGGGTGRFADATGSIHGTGIGEPIDPANPLVKTVHIEGFGSILY